MGFMIKYVLLIDFQLCRNCGNCENYVRNLFRKVDENGQYIFQDRNEYDRVYLGLEVLCPEDAIRMEYRKEEMPNVD